MSLPLKPRSVLIVDDNLELRELLGQMLERAGYQVATVGGGREGCQCLDQKTFDVVITDLLMAEMDGLELITVARKAHPRTRIIAMSGGGRLSGGHYLQLARGFGAHLLLAKPFKQHELLAAVEKVLTADINPPVP